ncbi:MAG: VWA domain-containing protein [Armatimonadetes bacterium]|nr:VWA domain-containing protein [Armatimonadota bacterium]
MSQFPDDPNKTVLTGFDPNKTVIGAGPADNRTVAMGAAPGADPNRTTAWAPPSQELSVTVTPSRIATMSNGPAREQFLVELSAPSDPGLPGVASAGPRTPLNLCLVIDRSGSMEGPPLEYAKQACGFVVDLMGPDDILSIVVFDETVEVLMAPQRVTNRQAVKDGISQLTPGYTTNLYDGIHLAAHQLAQHAESGRATRMVVLSDGDPTAGIKDFASLVAHAGDVKTRGITCTFLGFGPDYNEELLAAMAKKAGGNYYYIPQPQLIPEIFRTELQKLMSVSAMHLRLSLRLSRWVNLRGVTGHSVPPDSREFTLDLADLERGAVMQIVMDFDFPNHPLGHYRVAGGALNYTDASGLERSQNLDLVMEFTADAARYSAPVDPRVSAAAQVSAASRTVEKTIMGLKTQQITAAAALSDLQKTQALLMSQGRTSEAQEVTIAMQAIQRGDTGGAEKTLMGTMVNLDQGKK